MRTVQSRLYTNVVLTAIALLLGLWLLQPIMSLSSLAQAQDRFRSTERNSQQRARLGDLGSQFNELADASADVAEATREIAAAIRESAKSQKEIAKAIASLSESVQ